MDISDLINHMLNELDRSGCIYQDDAVDFAVKSNSEILLRENADGNLVLALPVLAEFKKRTINNVVWVNSGKYWRFRVLEDESGRVARG